MKWQNIELGYKGRIEQLAKLSPWELLGVAESCTPAELRAAYLRLVNTYHPDRADPFMSRNNEEVVKLINAAYDRLRSNS
ncbi:J domain-containing protein [Mesorhizobium sp. BR1-1-2]|uniref:J domain-containing protein n=1 Tax=Mesorhizobium sp. BR1-1-2 TaxID=2876652 RepID=UPI001CCABA6C|nr:J domain-containing protein [Mesorhizobium sp. BR1-1-2]MBZ9963736.1 J domain-containing protein [Mesorhizobium sp. BR1-1-2]